jgi:magnesium transporter
MNAGVKTMPSPPPAEVGRSAGGIVNCAAYDSGGNRRDLTLDEISDVLAEADGGFVWLGLHEPDDALLYKLQEEFGLHDLAIEDAQHAHQRPKIEAYGQSLFVAVHTAQVVDGEVAFGETHAFLGPRYLVTVRHGASLSYAAARSRVEREPEQLALGPAYALYAVLDYVVDNFQPIVDEFSNSLVSLEQEIFAEQFRRETVEKLYALKREVTRFRVAISPLQDILSQLARQHGALVPEEAQLYFRDVHDHAIRLNDSIDTLREMLTAAMNVNLSLVTVAQGEVVKRLAGWAALLAAPTLIASWYGMNFRHMPELDGRFAYPVLLGLVVVVCIGLYRYLKKVRWL